MRKVFSCLLSASLLTLVWGTHASEQITISEFLASNTSGLRDEDGQTNDWIEIRNAGTNAVNLDGWFLTDNDNNLTKWRFPATNIAANGFVIVFADSKDRKVPGATLHANFNLSASGEYLALVKPDGVTIATEFRQVNNGYPGQAPNVSYGFSAITTNITVITTNAPLRVRIPAADEGTNWTTAGYNDSAWIAGTNAVGYGNLGSLLRTDVRAAMSNVNASAYIRIPFTVNAPSNASLITLRLRYNDGLAAYVNGLEAVRLNAPNPPAFNSTATATHSSLTVEEFRLGSSALVEGTNVLAIQALNVTPNDPDFLLQAEMILTSIEAESPTPMYFTLPSPGSNNVAGVANPGPAILEPRHSPNAPSEEENILVTARVSPTFAPISTVAVRYRVMFNPEIELPMFDDGLHGDGDPNDGVFGATIPAATAASAGQMVRWYFRATDTANRPSRWPLFAAATHTEYLGTVIAPDYVTSKLPIVHLFAATGVLNPGPNASGTQPGADSEAGGRISAFHDGEFYDNVQMSLRGNSTAGFEKKSHRIEFNGDHPFRHSGPGPRIRKTSFVADYNDPTYMRQGLCYWLGDLIGAPSPFYIPHRLQLNGQFYQLGNFNDVNGEELLERLGYDPRGALYKAQGRVTNPVQSTGQPEKLTRRTEPNTDYNALADGISDIIIPNPINRKTNAFDQFDVPQLINYLVTARWSQENDDVWANMTLYRDTEGDQLWRIIPFDMNLAWGAIFAEGSPPELFTGVQSTNDTHKSHPLYGGSTILARSGPAGAWNRVYDVFFQVPEFREMFLRRMRTMLDQYIGPPGTPINASPAEQRILELYDLIYEEAINDRAWWGWRASAQGQNNFPPPPNPGAVGTATRTNAAIYSITNGVSEMLQLFVRARRQHFYERHSITNTRAPLYNGSINPASNTVAGIPLAQPTNVVINIGQIESNPSSGLQGHEFIQLTNPNPFAVDISGWKLSNAVSFTFAPGTVLVGNGVLYVTPDRKSFRTRATTPRTGQALLVVGDYGGQLDARGEPLILLADTGRIVHTNAYVPSPSPAQLYLRITEMMYHPAPPPSGSPYPQEDFEYLELKNIGPLNLNLVGIHFTNGISFTFRTSSPVTNLAPGQIVVLVRNAAAFTSRHGGTATIAGVYSNNLDNSGERISLHDAVGEQILDFTYNNAWYPVTDGLGFSLVIVNENADWATWDLKEAWRPSATDAASPGANDPPPPGPFAPMLVNEVLANTDFADVDRIEIHNPTTSAVDIGNWWISDDQFTPHKYRIPAPRMVPAGSFTVFTESDFNVGPNAFSFSARGDEAFLFSGDSAGNLNGYVHGFDFGGSDPGVSFGRYVNSQTNTHFVAQSSNTFGLPNTRPRVGPIVISEIMYRPPDLGTNDNDLDEYVELQNISTNAVSLYDPPFPTNRWELDDAIHFSFQAGTAIPAGGFLVVVSFDPANPAALAKFRSLYGLGTNVAIVGPFTGKLDNSEDRVELKRPDTSNITNVGLVLIDRVHYRDGAPWDANADGLGAALQRIVVGDYGNDPTNWIATVPNPGARVIGGALPVITSQPVNTTAVAGRTTNTFSVTATGALRFQWQANGTNIHGATNSTLVLANVSPAQAGVYRAIALNGAGLVFSSNALLTVLAPVTFTVQPVAQRVLPGTNVSVVATAIGSGGGGNVSYQWQFAPYSESGALVWSDIPNATSATYSFTGANLNEHHGSFRVIAYDNLSASVSAEAFIYVMVRPGFVVQPAHATVVQGGTAVFTCLATGAPPLFYRWIRNGIGVQTSTVPVLVLNNVQIPNPNPVPIRCSVTNLASGVGGVNSGTVNLLVHPDFDGDGVGDPWEAQYGFNTNNIGDGAADPDGDGASNRDEYVAGTDPLNAASVLRLERTLANSALQFVAQSNLSYSLQWRTNLSSASWLSLTNVAGTTNGVRVIQVPVANPPPDWERYYRVATPLVP